MKKGFTIVSAIIVILILAGAGLYFWRYLPGRTIGLGLGPKISQTPFGIIEGKVTIGPICPVERENSPCPVPPEVYTSRKVLVYKLDHQTLVAEMRFDVNGKYHFELPAGKYVIDLPKPKAFGFEMSGDLPKTIEIKAGQTSRLNFSIDTGIR